MYKSLYLQEARKELVKLELATKHARESIEKIEGELRTLPVKEKGKN